MEKSKTKSIEAAKETLKSEGYFVDYLWHVNDVHFICEQKGLPHLSHDEAMQVFKIASEQFDGEYGMCWPQLEKALGAFLKNRTIMLLP